MSSLPRNFHVNIPEALADEVMEAKPEHIAEIGIEWAAKQVGELLNKNVPAIHFYIMQNSKPVNLLMKKVKI